MEGLSASASTATGATLNTRINPVTLGSNPYSETAYDWWQRCRQRRKVLHVTNPSSAARRYVQQPNIPFIQQCNRSTRQRRQSIPPVSTTSLPQVTQQQRDNNGNNQRKRRRYNSTNHLPFIELSGPVAKTSTLLLMAAQFVVQTRPSRFLVSDGNNMPTRTSNNDNNHVLPQVFLLDSHWDISASMMQQIVRSLLLCDYDHMATTTTTTTTDTTTTGTAAVAATTTATEKETTNDETIRNDVERLDKDCDCCFQRIHIAHVDENNSAGWLPILEVLGSHLAEASLYHPTLVVWDGLMDISDSPLQGLADIQRTILRLVRDYDVMFVYTTQKAAFRKKNDWDDRVTHRIALDRLPPGSSHFFVAHTKGEDIPFSITATGIRT